MIGIAFAAAAVCLLVGARVLWSRPPAVDAAIVLAGGIAVAVWSVCAGFYARGPIPHQASALWLAAVSVACGSFAVCARRTVTRGWRPGRLLLGLLVLEPALLLVSALLPAHLWGRLFWDDRWHAEHLGVAYGVHTLYTLGLMVVGAAAMLRRAERVSGTDRWLAIGAAGTVAAGVAAQLVEVRVMHLLAAGTFVLIGVLILRGHRAGALVDLGDRDPVTGVLARAGLDAVLQHAVDVSARTTIPLSLLVVDIDEFKAINDTYGHVVGDLALAEAARRIRSAVGGIVGRFGGDEFVVVLSGMTAADAAAVADRVVALTGRPLPLVGADVRLTVSIGIAQYRGGTLAETLAAADHAMYVAKRRGGNGFERCVS